MKRVKKDNLIKTKEKIAMLKLSIEKVRLLKPKEIVFKSRYWGGGLDG